MNSNITRAAIAGIGGFGEVHHESMLRLEKEHRTQVVATCDPRAAELQNLCEKFKFAERGVRVYTGFEELMAQHGGKLDLINVSTPIRAHAPMHAECVARGIPCYLEKPPTLDPEELRIMIERDSHARKATQVGFIYIAQPSRIELKRQILAGDFGRLLRVSYHGLWPRAHTYYARSNWAGCLTMGDYILLDSCCGNAMSHHLHNILFFAGQSEVMDWAGPGRVEAELYRANAIEGADTVFARGELANGVEFRIAASHACGEFVSREILTFDNAEIEIFPGQKIEIRHCDGRRETRETDGISLTENLGFYLDYLGGKRPRPATLLSDCRPVVDLNALLYVAASRITSVEAPHRLTVKWEEAASHKEVIADIDSASLTFIEKAQFPSEAGLPWAAPGGSSDASHLKDLRQSLETIRKHSASTPVH